MSTTRLSKTRIEHSFSIVPNELTFSNDLTLAEKGALIWLLAKPEKYGINQKSLATHWGIGLHTVKRISKKLQQTGYLEIQKLSTGETIWHITDTPIVLNKPSLDSTAHEPKVENQPLATEQTIEPEVEKPQDGNRPVLKRTDPLQRTDLKNTCATDVSLVENDEVDSSFENLWKDWHNKKNRKAAKSAFKSVCKKSKANPQFIVESLKQDILARLTNQQLGFDKMMMSSYLNGERWLDDITENKPKAEKKRVDPLLAAMGMG